MLRFETKGCDLRCKLSFVKHELTNMHSICFKIFLQLNSSNINRKPYPNIYKKGITEKDIQKEINF